MKIFNIFKKNLKTVSRNWDYFVILFIFPAFLILVAGNVLNSTDYSNIKIGSVGDTSSLNLNSENIIHYNSLGECLEKLNDSKVNMCLSIKDIDKKIQITAYIKETNLMVKSYLKQFLYLNILKGQSNQIQESSKKLSSKLNIYFASTNDAEIKLNQISKELDQKKEILLRYKENLSELRDKFEKIYIPLKKDQQSLKDLQNNSNEIYQNSNDNINKLEDTQEKLIYIRSFLNEKLSEEDFLIVKENLDEVIQNLDEINKNLIEEQKIIENLSMNLDEVIENLDEIHVLLIQLDEDLDNFIQENDREKSIIQGFIKSLDYASEDIKNLSNNNENTKTFLVNFNQLGDQTEFPVLKLFPFIVALIILFTSLIISDMFILRKVNDPSYFRDLITPTSDTTFLIANYLTNILFLFIQISVLFLIGKYWFGFSKPVLNLFVLILFVSSSFFILIGMSFGYLIKNQNLSLLTTIFFIISLLIISDIMIAPILAKPIIRLIIEYNPFFILKQTLTELIVFGKYSGISQIFLRIFSVYIVISIIFLYISKKINKSKFRN